MLSFGAIWRWYRIYFVSWATGRTRFNLMSTTVDKSELEGGWKKEENHTTKRETINWNRIKCFDGRAKTSRQNVTFQSISDADENDSPLMVRSICKISDVFRGCGGKCLDRYELISFTHSIKITITVANVLENDSITLFEMRDRSLGRIAQCSSVHTRTSFGWKLSKIGWFSFVHCVFCYALMTVSMLNGAIGCGIG